MANDGTIKIGTELDESGLKSGINNLGSYAKKGLFAVGKAAAGAATITVGALAAVATGIGAAVKSGVEYNAQMENYTASFKTMLGSEEAAVAKVNELKKMGAETPFELSDLASATTTLLAFGTDADDVTGILQRIGDVSLGNAEKFSSLSLVYGQVSSQGKLMGQDLLQMINAGFNPLQVISEHTGQSMAELKSQMEKGAISADMVAQAFEWATEEGGQFHDGMKTASTTFDGLISTLKDNANSLIGEVVKPISDSLTKTLLPEAIGAVDTLTKAFEKDGLPGLINAAGGVVGQIITGITEQAPKFIQMASGFLSTLLSAILAQLPALQVAGTGIVNELISAIATNLPLLLQIVLSIITTIASAILANLPAIVSCGLDLVVSLIQGLTNALPQLLAMLPSVITAIVTTLVDHIPEILQCAAQLLVALVDGITAALPQLIEMLPTVIITLVDTLLSHLGEIIQCALQILVALIQGLSQALPQLIAYMPKIIATIIKVLVENLPFIIQAAIQIIMALITGLIQAIPQLILAVPEIINAIKDAFNGFDWSTLGKNIIEGIKTGITSAAGKLADAAKDAAKKALDSVKSFLGIHSPSKVWNKQIGRQMPAGGAEGIEDNAYMLEDASVDSAEAALKAAQGVSASGMLSQMQGESYGRAIGMTGGQTAVAATSGGTSGVDPELIGKEIAKALSGAEVKMDGQTVGRLVTPYVDSELGILSNLKARYA